MLSRCAPVSERPILHGVLWMDHCSVPELRKKEATVRRMGHQHPYYILNEQGEHRKPRLPEMILILDAQTLKWPNPLA
jgi:hypothetical protein